jgi:hypothetical protein
VAGLTAGPPWGPPDRTELWEAQDGGWPAVLIPVANLPWDTCTLGGPGPAPSWTHFAVLAKAPPLAGHSFVVTLVLVARAENLL